MMERLESVESAGAAGAFGRITSVRTAGVRQQLPPPQPAPRTTRAEDPFLDARILGAPTIGPETVIRAPFGWIGLVRDLGRKCGTLLGDTDTKILSLTMSTSSGISIELARPAPDPMMALHSLASETGQAAACIDPETGLVGPQALQGFVDFWSMPGRQVPAIELPGLSSITEALPQKERRRLVADTRILLSGPLPPAFDAPLLKDWILGFPPGAMTVEIVGEVGRGRTRLSVAEPVVAVDGLRRFVRTTHRLYRLRTDRAVTEMDS